VHFGGGVHVAGGFRGGVYGRAGGSYGARGYSYSRGGWGGYRGVGGGYRGRGWGIGGHAWVGGGYGWYNPWYYGYPYDGYGYVPSYYGGGYGGSYYPVDPGSPGVAAGIVAPVVRPPLPRFGIGAAAGAVNVDNQSDSSDLAVLGRVRITDGWLIEGELGKTTMQNDLRVDRRLGASLIYEIGARNRFAPYVVGEIGVEQDSIGGSYSTDQSFAEVGAGLRFAVTPHFHIAADIRAGSRSAADDSNQPQLTGVARTVEPSTTSNDDYTRGRLSAIFYF
jgi:hypothetical protein